MAKVDKAIYAFNTPVYNTYNVCTTVFFKRGQSLINQGGRKSEFQQNMGTHKVRPNYWALREQATRSRKLRTIY